MLVLSRKINETILIGDDVKVTLLAVDGDKIKLGIDAPKHIKIFREELLRATIVLNQQALKAPLVHFDLNGLRDLKENSRP